MICETVFQLLFPVVVFKDVGVDAEKKVQVVLYYKSHCSGCSDI